MLTNKGRNIYLILSGGFLSFPLYFFLVWKNKLGTHKVSLEEQYNYVSEYSFIGYNTVNYIAIGCLIFSLTFILRLTKERHYLKWIGLGLLGVNGFLFFHYLRLIILV